MNKGQQAMAVVVMGGLSQTTVRGLAEVSQISHPRIVYANVVKQYAPDLVDAVLNARKSLDEAYSEAQARKGAASSMEAQDGPAPGRARLLGPPARSTRPRGLAGY